MTTLPGLSAFDTWQLVALAAAVGWASGIRLYAVLFVVGGLGYLGVVDLPGGLNALAHPWVLAASGFMFCVEFFADKIPGVDSTWDALHTFIRIPAGAMLAAGAVGDVTPALAVAAGLIGGGITAATHATKAGSRLLINTSPEPFSNWFASIGEDLAVFAGLWAALAHPAIFLILLVLFLLSLCWLLPKVWRGVKTVFRKIASLFGRRPENPSPV
jgi:hypothetical protein